MKKMMLMLIAFIAVNCRAVEAESMFNEGMAYGVLGGSFISLLNIVALCVYLFICALITKIFGMFGLIFCVVFTIILIIFGGICRF